MIVKKKAGQKHKLEPRCVRGLLNYVRNYNWQPLPAISASLRTKFGVKLSKVLYDATYIVVKSRVTIVLRSRSLKQTKLRIGSTFV